MCQNLDSQNGPKLTFFWNILRLEVSHEGLKRPLSISKTVLDLILLDFLLKDGVSNDGPKNPCSAMGFVVFVEDQTFLLLKFLTWNLPTRSQLKTFLLRICEKAFVVSSSNQIYTFLTADYNNAVQRHVLYLFLSKLVWYSSSRYRKVTTLQNKRLQTHLIHQILQYFALHQTLLWLQFRNVLWYTVPGSWPDSIQHYYLNLLFNV